MGRSLFAAPVAGVVLLLAGVAPSADAASAKPYKSCKALNKVYAHGVGLKGARDRSSEERVTNFTRNNRVYRQNDGKGGSPPLEYDLDRDNDGIACEQL
jgi:hypothetical protein